MKVIRSGEKSSFHEHSIFLAGPTPRTSDVASWRPEALHFLQEELYFDGVVYVPEPFTGNVLEQMQWERNALNLAGSIALWMPRQLQDMPGFTSNVEFGYFVRERKFFYGRPDAAPHTGYLDWLYVKERGRTPCKTLPELLREAWAWATGHESPKGEQ